MEPYGTPIQPPFAVRPDSTSSVVRVPLSAPQRLLDAFVRQ